MPFNGLAFEMSAVDDGMNKAIGKALSLLDSVNDMFDRQGKAMVGAKNKAVQYFGYMQIGAKDALNKFSVLDNKARDFFKNTGEYLKKGKKDWEEYWRSTKEKWKKRADSFNLASIAANMKNLTGETGNLTNSLEATMVSMQQTTKPIIAQLNISSKEMARINSRAASTAYAMNTDAGAVAETMVSLKTANEGAKKSLDALNMSEKDWVKVVQTTQMPMSDYTAILGDMTASWNAAPKDAAAMIDNMMAIGKAAGVGTLALKSTKGTLDSLSDTFKSLPPGFSRTGSEIQSLVESTGYLAGALRDMGQAPEDAMTAASAAAKMFAEQSVIITKAFQIGGPNADLSGSGLFTYLNSLGIGSDQVKAIVDLGSRDAVAGMKAINDLYSQVGQSKVTSAQAVLSGLGEELGQGASALAFLAKSTDFGTDALDKFAKMAIKGDGAIKKYGDDAYSSGLTLQDSFDRAKLAFDTTIRSISRGDVRKLVREQIKGMKEAGKDLAEMGKSSSVVKTLSMYKQMGMGGVFASLAESSGIGAKNATRFGAKAGLVVDTVSQLGSELAPIAQMFGMLGPFGPLLAAGGIGALFVMDEQSANNVLGPLYSSFKKLKDKIVGFWYSPELQNGINKAKEYIKSIWTDTIVPALPDIGSAIYGALKWAWDEVGKQLGTKGQLGVGLAAAFSLGFGDELIGIAGKAGISLMAPLLSPKTGLLAIATAAGFIIGNAIGDKLTGDKNVAAAANEARKMLLKSGEMDFYTYAASKGAGWLDEKLAKFEAAKKYEEGTISPDAKMISDINKGIAFILRAKQASNVEKFGNVGDVNEYLNKSTLMDPLEAEGLLMSGMSEDYGVGQYSESVISNNAQATSGANIGNGNYTKPPKTDEGAKQINNLKKIQQDAKVGKVGTAAAIQREGQETRSVLNNIYSELTSQTRLMGGGRGKSGRGADPSVAPVGH